MSTKRKTPKAVKVVKAWAIMYHDNPSNLFQSLATSRLHMYTERKDAMDMALGPVRRVEIRVVEP